MTVGTHSVVAFADPNLGLWSDSLASNPYFANDMTGWKAIPWGATWQWATGMIHSVNSTAAYQAVGRDPAYPVARPAEATQFRLRATVLVPTLATPSTKVRVYALVRFGRTPQDAFDTPEGPDEKTLMTWVDLATGTHTIDVVLTGDVDPTLTYLSPQLTFDPTPSAVAVDTLDLTARSGEEGMDLSCLVDTVSISHGRNDASSQPEASSCTLELTANEDYPLPRPIDVGNTIVVTTTTASVVSVRFVGKITDLALGWDDAGEDTPDAGVGQVVAVGVLADLGRRVVGDVPWPQELDGARVANIMAAAGIELDPFYSDAGTVDLLPRDVDARAALEVAHAAATSAMGVVWQTRDGEVRYADANHRGGSPQALTLDSCDVFVTPTWRRTTEGLVNKVSIGYGPTPEDGEQERYVADSAASIAKWGTFDYTNSTELAALADAQDMGNLLLVRNSNPVWVMSDLPVDVAGLDQERYDALLGLDMHSLIALTGLPSLGHAPTSANLWVEGWSETLAFGEHTMNLIVSGYCRTAPPPTWDDTPAEWTWGGATLTEERRNLITNPSFEVDTAGWASWGSGSIARQAGTAPTGAAYLRCTTGDTTNSGTARQVPAVAGRRYGVSAKTRINAAEGVRVRLQFLDAANVQTGLIDGATTIHPTSAWGDNTVEGTAPAGTTSFRVIIGRVNASAVGQLLDVDAVLAYAIAGSDTLNPAYFDGDTADTATADYRWAGDPHVSESVHSLITTVTGGVPPTLTWDDVACSGGPSVSTGRWNDQPATLRWDQVDPAADWDTYV